MTKIFFLWAVFVVCVGYGAGQATTETASPESLINTEISFAKTAAEKGTRTAFLEFMADDSVVFVPEKVSGKAYWTSRPESKGLLSWAPNYADVSSNGILGYTTGNAEYRAKGKDDVPSWFGEFVTIWLRQPGGSYKFVLDIGVDHGKPERYSTNVSTPPASDHDLNSKGISAADSANGFFETAHRDGLKKAYELYSADDVRFFRENSFAGLGRRSLISDGSKKKATIKFAKRSVFFQSADLAYVTNTYQYVGVAAESGNFMQVWKLRKGKWQIVLDVFKPVPPK